MRSRVLVLLSLFCFTALLVADDAPGSKEPPKDGKKDASNDTKIERKKTGRPGELTAEEEDKLDKIIERFIRYDLNYPNGGLEKRQGLTEAEQRAWADFKSLGPEAIPALL